MAEALVIIPMVSALTGTSMMAMLTMSPEGGLIKCVKNKVNSMSYDDQIWNKMNTSTGQLSVQFTALTQWMSTMAQYGNTRKRQLNSVRLELSLPIRREFKDNDGKIKVLEPYPLVPHYYHVPRVGAIWRFSLSHFPTIAEHREKYHPQKNPSKREKKKVDKLYSVWIESIGYKATDDVTAFKITWPKDNPTLFNYWNTMIWMLTRYDFNTGLVMDNIRMAMQPNPHPLLENDVLALFATVKEDDLRMQRTQKAKEELIISPYAPNTFSSSTTKNTCQTTTLDVPLSHTYRNHHPKADKAKRRVHSSDDEEQDSHSKQIVLVLKTSSKKKKESPKVSQSLKIGKQAPVSSSGFFGAWKSNKENSGPASPSGSKAHKKPMKWAEDDDLDDIEISENPLIRASLSSQDAAHMISRLSVMDEEYSPKSMSCGEFSSPLEEIQSQQVKRKNKSSSSSSRKKKAGHNLVNIMNTDITARSSFAL